MIGLILASHGDFSKAALASAEMLIGEQEKVEVIGFFPGESLETLLERFTSALERLADCDELLAMVDIQGGSPCNAATVMKMQHPKLHVIAGFSLPLILQFFEWRSMGTPLSEQLSELTEVGRISLNEITL